MLQAQNRTAIFAISDAEYAALALTMFDSVCRFYPDADFFFFIIGTGEATTLNDNINVVYAADIFDDLDLSQRLVHYLQIELVTSVPPHCFQHLFAKGYERCIYLDPDLFFFRRMTEIDDLLDGDCNGIVTPHALRSITDDLFGGDNIFLLCGIFNLGFLALKNTSETARMLAWWRDKLKWKCTVDCINGHFVDQKWLEFLPVYFEGFHILRLPTYNLAPWNSEHYDILRDADENYFIDNFDTPVAFMHFSGVKRMERHFRDMKEARLFYIRKLQERRFQRLDFTNYETRFQGSGLFFDKICSFLYRDYVRNTNDDKSNPLINRWFYEYIHAIDKETGFPVYIRKLYEILPDIFVGYLSTKLATNWDNMIWLVKNHFNLDSVVSLETMVHLRNNVVRPGFVILNPEAASTCAMVTSPYAQAVQTFSSYAKYDALSAQPDKSITFKSDRLEIKSGTLRICIPHLDSAGNLPTGADLATEHYTEIWVPSALCKERFAKDHCLLNVTPILQPVIRPGIPTKSVNLPVQKFVVLLRHDCKQDFADQDPLASIHAFKEAFGRGAEALLVCFLANGTSPTVRKSLISAAADAANIFVVEGGDADYYGYLHRANCFISLHQDTAIGVAIAEAMSLGKEVVATTGGATSHYLNADNSFPIEPVSAIEVIKKAAEALRGLCDETNVMVSRGRNARLFAQKHLSAQSVGFSMQKRIEELQALQEQEALKQKQEALKQKQEALKPPDGRLRKLSRKLRRLAGRSRPAKETATVAIDAPAVPSVGNGDQQQTDAVIKILLSRVVRPGVME